MEQRIEKAIKEQIRFEWEQRMDPTGGTEKMEDKHVDHIAEEILAGTLDIDYTPGMIREMDKRIRRGFNRTCNEYDSWLESLGPKMD